MIRVVLDANVVVAAMLNPPAQVVDKARDDFDLVWSPPIVAECHRVVDYRKIRNRFRIRDPHLFINDLAEAAIMVATELPQVEAVRADPSDDVYIATALVGAARWVVSGDQHLTELERFAGVRLVAPSVFLVELAAR